MHTPPTPARFLHEVRRTARLAAPLAAGHLASGLVSFVDALIAGHHGTATLAAMSVGTALLWLPLLAPMGTLMALPPAVSQLDGGGRRAEIGPLFRQALWLALALGLGLFVLLSLAPLLLRPMGITADIVPGVTAFLHAVRWGIPAFTLYLAMRYLSDGLHWSMPTMLVGFGGLALLAPVAYVLTNGRLGLPALGVVGIGVATALVFWAQALAFAWYLARSPRFRDLALFSHWQGPRWAALRPLLRTGLPIGVMVTMEGGLFAVTALLIGRLGDVPVAAHQVALNVATLCFMLPFGIAEATTVRVGHALGRSDLPGIRNAAFAGLVLAMVTQTCSALLMLLGHNTIAALYSTDPAVIALGGSLLLYAALFQFPDGVQVVCAGALRGLQDTRVPMWLTALAYWGIGMPVGAGLGLWLGWGPKGMWLGLSAGLLVAAILLSRRFLRSSQQLPTRHTPMTDGA
ncbi:MAG TPA: MATE family efflux transporter [Thermomonas sp.]|jgi:MATE family multidrug resistance protein|uniref:MATE family efflux transporter n=1 Tax=Thermomonas sp. TaxID=1971895 RepID=UPI002B82D1E1|nr:MATE family efflux transporter [Thermomonas sp.]HOV95161.1 MATE family efflux transporter [Thermomonas sp.]